VCATSVSLSFAHIIVTKYNLCFLLSVVILFISIFSMYTVSYVLFNRHIASFCHDNVVSIHANLKNSLYAESLHDPPHPVSSSIYILFYV